MIAINLRQTFEPIARRLISPQSLSRFSTCLPSKVNILLVERLSNMAFYEQINEGEFEFLTEKTLQIELLDAALFIGLSYNLILNKITCTHFNNIACSSDVTLSVNTADAISLMQQQVDPDTLFFQRRLKINGDTELAHQVKNTVDTLNSEVIPLWIMKLLAHYKSNLLIK